MTPPRMRLCILKAKTFLPSAAGGVLVLADALEHPPHGLRISAQMNVAMSATSVQPTSIMNSR